MKSAIVYFHQGWTDIINCLGLITHYSKHYGMIFLIMKLEAKCLCDFYIKDKSYVIPIYIAHTDLDYETCNVKSLAELITYFQKYTVHSLQDTDFLGIGMSDKFRNDQYKDAYSNIRNGNGNFVKAFYDSYGIEYNTRISNFEFTRDLDAEEAQYNKFIAVHGEEYILYHDTIDKSNVTKNVPLINLDRLSDVYFDMIKILINAHEIHLLDSSWGAFIYQLDAKYGLFRNKQIFLYAKRGHIKMFTEPIKNNNWIIIV